MALQLAPETESRVREHAARNGVSVDELLRRAFADDDPPAAAPASPPSAAEDTEKERVRLHLRRLQKEYGLPPRPDGKQEHTALAELSAQWKAEDAHLSEDEWEAERQFWEDYERERPHRPLDI